MTAAVTPDLSGVRVLVVEDSLLVAESITDLLEFAGATIIGPFGRLAPALAAAEREKLDGALLDVNLAGESAGPIAAALQDRDIPFIFLTGYSDPGALPPGFRDTPRLVKPFPPHDLAVAVATRFARAAPTVADSPPD